MQPVLPRYSAYLHQGHLSYSLQGRVFKSFSGIDPFECDDPLLYEILEVGENEVVFFPIPVPVFFETYHGSWVRIFCIF